MFVSLLFNESVRNIENNVNVRVFIDLAADEAKTDELEEAKIKALDGVESIFRSKTKS